MLKPKGLFWSTCGFIEKTVLVHTKHVARNFSFFFFLYTKKEKKISVKCNWLAWKVMKQ